MPELSFLNKNQNSSDKNRNAGNSVCSGFLSVPRSNSDKNAKCSNSAILAVPIRRNPPFASHLSEKSSQLHFIAETIAVVP